jgi:hypothetical protein
MADRTLRSRTDEIKKDDVELTTRESDRDWLCDSPKLLDDSSERVVDTNIKLRQDNLT